MARTKIDEMHEGVKGSEEDDDGPAQLVQIDVLIQRQKIAQSAHPQPCDAATQHENHHKGTIEIQHLACIVVR